MHHNTMLVVLLMSCCQFLSAQGLIDRDKPFSYRAGYQYSLLHDQLSSPLLYGGHSLALGLVYEKKEANFFEVELHLSIGNSQPVGLGRRKGSITDVPDFYGQRETYDIALNPFLSMFQGQGNLRWGLQKGPHAFGLGLGLHHTLSAMRLDSWNYTQVSLAPFYAAQFKVGAGEVECLAEFPLLSWVVRPNFSSDAYIPGYTSYYLTYVLTESKVVHPGSLVNPHVRLLYTFPAQSSKRYGLGLKANYLYYPNPQPFAMLNSEVFFQVQF